MLGLKTKIFKSHFFSPYISPYISVLCGVGNVIVLISLPKKWVEERNHLT